ncbi:putative sterigmatocystin biosynthesis P450 monooxygenase STCB-like protein 1 [Colletotrichum chlorophyti]|uniref:Putative sterigmatocystin biosynthesis P450 monooxygenase STCB-like protein 1 n=1 Tax=Colletotrichum chlorophyti TaxID=708187 RepID=A0A1Q8RYX4_9PEZI|nr:putative sterigmatocystin biosynthesis P450 monooxygenase STCB-like protein 1 [Colletotrichum chlorophyti]
MNSLYTNLSYVNLMRMLPGAALFAILYFVYLGITNPLSHIPGPWYTRFTAIPSTYKRYAARHPVWIHELHAKYGPIVRFSPLHVDICDLPTSQHIHGVQTGFHKTLFYADLVPDSSNVFTETRPDVHAKYKRLLAQPMSETGLRVFYSRIDSHSRLAIEGMRNEYKTRGAADIAKWFTLFSYDCIGDLVFGQSFDTLKTGTMSQSVQDFAMMGYVSNLRITFPILSRLAKYLPIPVFKDARALQQRTVDYAQQSLDRYAERVKGTSFESHPTLFSSLYSAGEEKKLTPIQMRDNAQVYIVGGTDTTATTLVYLIWSVCKNPQIRSRLLKELGTLPDDYTYDSQLKDLTYLNWIIQETLRLYSALPAGLPRLVPAGGEKLAGYYVPGGLTVTTQAYSLHRDEKAFPDPDRFYPERWEYPTQRMKDCFLAFGAGARTCSGRNLAMIELRLMVSRFFKAFPEALASGLEGMSDGDMIPALYFLVMPSGHRCLMNLSGENVPKIF